MADLQTLERAFMKAHKAGDTKAAGVLASEIKKQRAASGAATANKNSAPTGGAVQAGTGGFDEFARRFKAGEFNPPQTTMGDMGRQFQKGLLQGAAGLASFPAMAGEWLGDKATAGIDAMLGKEHKNLRDIPGSPLNSPLNPANLSDIVSRNVGIGEPKTTPGAYANTIGQFLPGVLIGGPAGMGQKVLSAVGGGAASEGAGQMTKGTPLEPYARFAGGLAGGLVPDLMRRAITPMPISPERAKLVNTLKNEGVELTAGQKTGNKPLQYAESEIGGGKAAYLMERQGEQFTAAALRKAGISAERATPEVIDKAFSSIGQKFDGLAARNSIVPDRQLATDLVAVGTDYASAVPQSAQVPAVKNSLLELANKMQTGPISGEFYKAMRSRLDRVARSSADPEAKMALRGMMESLDDAMERSIAATGSQDLGAWRQVRKDYRNMLVIEQAATGAGEKAAEGLISPSALRNATIQKQTRRAYARGKGDFADLARAGEATMKPLPNSGTAPRTAARAVGTSLPALIGAALGGQVGGAESILLGGLLGSGLPYGVGRTLMSKPVQAYLGNQLLANPAALPLLRRELVPFMGAGASVSNPRN